MPKQSSDELMAVSVYMPKELHKKILDAAQSERRSISSQIVVLLEKTVKG